jgi:hypothetical protein
MFDIAKPIVGLCAAWRIGLQCARPGLHSESGDLDLESLGTWNPSLDLEPTSCGRKRGLYRDGEPSARPRRRRRQLSLQERVLERVGEKIEEQVQAVGQVLANVLPPVLYSQFQCCLIVWQLGQHLSSELKFS